MFQTEDMKRIRHKIICIYSINPTQFTGVTHKIIKRSLDTHTLIRIKFIRCLEGLAITEYSILKIELQEF